MPESACKSILLFAVAGLVLTVTACDRGERGSAPTIPVVAARFPAEQIATGARLYGEHCAQCHGPEAQGHPDWQNAASGGFVAAPPLDASGPLPQRSRVAMLATIQTGARRNGEPIMPAWQGRLSVADIDAIIAWILAQWPAPQYEAWRAANNTASTHPQ